MRIKKVTQSLLKGLIFNERKNSTQDAYSCDYINNKTEVKSIPVTELETPSGRNPGSYANIVDNVVIIQLPVLWFNGAIADTYKEIATIPKEFAKECWTSVIFCDGTNQNVLEVVPMWLSPEGVIKIRTKSTYTGNHFIRGQIVYILDK